MHLAPEDNPYFSANSYCLPRAPNSPTSAASLLPLLFEWQERSSAALSFSSRPLLWQCVMHLVSCTPSNARFGEAPALHISNLFFWT